MTPALIAVAARAGAPFVERALRERVGGVAGNLAAEVVGQIAGDLGTTPDRVDEVVMAEPDRAEAAVRRVDASMSDRMVELYEKANEGQFALAMAETNSERFFCWAWRPLAMWGLGFLWFWNVMILHIANAYWRIALPQMDLAILLQLTVVYCGLYMGGHTVKSWAEQKWGNR